MNEVKKPGIEIQLDEQVAMGNYCNLAIIAHSTSVAACAGSTE